MGTLGEESKVYEPQKTLTVADLEVIRLDVDLETKEGEDKDGKKYVYKVMTVENVEYRVPWGVLADIKEILKVKPNTKCVKVTKKGEGLATTYSVIQLD